MPHRNALHPIQVLLAEDNDDDIVLIEEAFRESEIINVMNVVHDGVETLSYLRQEGEYQGAPRPHLVILDINMPRKNGLEVLREVKADPDLRRLPVVVLTSSETIEDVRASYAGGASTFITKPVVYEEFAGAMRRFEQYWGRLARLLAD